MQALSTLRYNFTATRVNVWQHIGASDAAAMADIEQQMATKYTLEEQALQAYEALAIDAKDKELLLADRAAIDGYEIVKQKAVILSRAGKKAEATAYVLGEAPALARMGDHINEHFAYLATVSTSASATANSTELSAIRAAILLGVFTVGFVGVIGYFVFRQITGQLGGEPGDIVSVANKVVLGDFSSEISLRPGDTTSMFAAVAKMQQGLQARTESDREFAESERRRAEEDRVTASENARVRFALDRVSVGVMLADMDGKIIYNNDFGTNIFRFVSSRTLAPAQYAETLDRRPQPRHQAGRGDPAGHRESRQG
jgi:methyl-accepting chemotaxis protein